MQLTKQQSKDRFNDLLNQCKAINLPEVRSLKDWRDIKQHSMLIDFDSFQRIDHPSSMIDFIIKKGNAEVLVAITEGWLQLSEEQRQRIEQAGKSFLIYRADLIEEWHTTLYNSCQLRDIKHELLGSVREEVQTGYWVYHNRHGWQNGAQ